MMTKADRAELRSLIRQRFKVLRADVAQREKELYSELEERLNERCDNDDKAWSDVMFIIGQAVDEADRKANDAVVGLVGRDAWPHSQHLVRSYELASIRRAVIGHDQGDERVQLRRQGRAKIEATVKGAMLQLDRQEVDLLEQLTTGALESDEARNFLGQIPTVSQLVPTARLFALETALKDTER